MKNHLSLNRNMKAFAQLTKPLTAEIRHLKTFKLSQQHKGVKK